MTDEGYTRFRWLSPGAGAVQALTTVVVDAATCEFPTLMITFTPLSGAAQSSRTTPLCYLLQVDDVRILLDCGSPDWNPEESHTTTGESGEEEPSYPWDEYCRNLRE